MLFWFDGAKLHIIFYLTKNNNHFDVLWRRSRSVPAPSPLRLFTGCLTVFGRRGDGAGSEGVRRGKKFCI